MKLATFLNLRVTPELKFIYHYPDIAAKIMTVSPYYEPSGELQKRLEKGSVAMPHHII